MNEHRRLTAALNAPLVEARDDSFAAHVHRRALGQERRRRLFGWILRGATVVAIALFAEEARGAAAAALAPISAVFGEFGVQVQAPLALAFAVGTILLITLATSRL
jgi:hypothetical protein